MMHAIIIIIIIGTYSCLAKQLSHVGSKLKIGTHAGIIACMHGDMHESVAMHACRNYQSCMIM